MAEITPTYRYVLPMGSVKIEVMLCEDIDDADTVVTQIQHPLFGFGVATSDATPMTAAINPAVSGRTVTVNTVDLTGDNDDVVLVMFGF